MIFRKYINLFFVQGENEMTETLLKRLNKSGKVHMVPASLKGKYVIRFTVTSQYTTDQDIERDWKIISDTATKVSLNPVTKNDLRLTACIQTLKLSFVPIKKSFEIKVVNLPLSSINSRRVFKKCTNVCVGVIIQYYI